VEEGAAMKTKTALERLEAEAIEAEAQASRCYGIYIMAKEAMQIAGKQERLAVLRLNAFKETHQ
jgi:hypothetical protein